MPLLIGGSHIALVAVWLHHPDRARTVLVRAFPWLLLVTLTLLAMVVDPNGGMP